MNRIKPYQFSKKMEKKLKAIYVTVVDFLKNPPVDEDHPKFRRMIRMLTCFIALEVLSQIQRVLPKPLIDRSLRESSSKPFSDDPRLELTLGRAYQNLRAFILQTPELEILSIQEPQIDETELAE